MKTLIAMLVLGQTSSPEFQRVTVKGDPMRLSVSAEIPKSWKEIEPPGGIFQSASVSHSFIFDRHDFGISLYPGLLETQRWTQEKMQTRYSQLMASLKAQDRGYEAVQAGDYQGVIFERMAYPETDHRHKAGYQALLKGPTPSEWIRAILVAQKADLNEKDRRLFRRIVESIRPE